MKSIKAFFSGPSYRLSLLLLVFTLPFSLPSLRLFFTGDHVMNLYYYVNRPAETLVNTLFFWSPFHRPFGGMVYLAINALFGMQPLWYYLFAVILFSLNTLLLVTLLWRITEKRHLALVAAGFVALHPENIPLPL